MKILLVKVIQPHGIHGICQKVDNSPFFDLILFKNPISQPVLEIGHLRPLCMIYNEGEE